MGCLVSSMLDSFLPVHFFLICFIPHLTEQLLAYYCSCCLGSHPFFLRATMLEYDDSAFYYFCMTMLSFYMLPGTYYLIFKQLLPSLIPSTDSDLVARTEVERRKAKQLKEEARSSNNLKSCGLVTNAVLLVMTYGLFVFLVLRVWNDAEIAQFDPYAILEISTDAEDRAIRKAYRSLSLKWHPDKNMGNQYAEQMFMMVRKAYEALTDEVAKENWQKYGNPDGKQALEVSIGLPTFLLEKDNHTTILLVYLVVLVIAIPLGVYCWYSESQQYGEKNVMHRTYNDYAALLAEATPARYLPSILVTSNECVKANASSKASASPSPPPASAAGAVNGFAGMDPAEAEDLRRLVTALGPTRLVKPKHEKHLKALAEVTKGNVLLHAYLYRLDIPPRFRPNLRKMLLLSGDLIEAMLEILQKTRWLQTALGVLDLQQQLTQAIMVREPSDALYQLPHLTATEVGHITKGKGSVKSISDYCRLPDDQKKGLATMTEGEKTDVLQVCKLLPRVEVSTEVGVEDESEIAEGDLVTVKVSVTRVNLPEGASAGAVHAPYFPATRREGWWVILAHGQKVIIAMERVENDARTFTHELKVFGPGMPLEAGHYKFDLYVKSDCYVGLDVAQKVEFDVIKASELPEYVPHKDDLELDNEPTLFESLAGNLEDDSDSDLEMEEEEEGEEGEGPKDGVAKKDD